MGIQGKLKSLNSFAWRISKPNFNKLSSLDDNKQA